MISSKTIKKNLIQIFALTEKNVKLNLRFKYQVIISFITPILSILMPLIILEQFFQFSERFDFSIWNENNYFVFQFMAYQVLLLKRVIQEFPTQLRIEKFWKTLPIIIIAPFNRFNLLLGILFSQLILISIPFIIFSILCYIYYPISFLTVIFIIIIFFLITLIFSGIGLLIGIFAISNENVWKALSFIVSLIFWVSCVTYPFDIFPEFIQQIINLNPLYYIFDLLRLAWIYNDVLLTITLLSQNFIILIAFSIILPCLGVVIFNLIYKKYGIVGY